MRALPATGVAQAVLAAPGRRGRSLIFWHTVEWQGKPAGGGGDDHGDAGPGAARMAAAVADVL
ncbi:MAG: hypothetical protein M3492_05990, partial [Actinomycetota bacterium]|nr:hypothetical protein [Actinomycetota bacterium]